MSGVHSSLATNNHSNWHTSASSFSLSASDATSGVAATYYTIDGGGTQTYAGSAVPVSGDASHTITYWSVDNAGNIEGAHTAYMNIDQTPPATTASGLATNNHSNWHTSASSFSLSASDATSGVAATYYTIDGGGTQTYAGSAVPVSGDASHTITYWSVDNAGNIEGAHTAYMNIDTTPPSAISGLASATDPSQSSWYANATPAFSWNAATDATSGLAGYSYVLDQSAGTVPAATVNTTATSYTSAALADGTWYFHVRAIDNAGNAGTTATYCVKTDTTPPVTTDNHTSVSLVAPTTITLSATDTGSGMSGGAAATLYRIEPATSYQTGSTVTLTSPGSYTVDYYSIDAAGNQEAPQSFTVTVRAAAAPSSASAYGFAANATSDWQTTPQTVTITASGGDGASRTINYSTDGGATWSAVVADSTDVQLAADGSYHIEYYASDSLASEATHDAGWVNIDQTPPATTASGLATNNHSNWHTSASSFSLSASDATSGVAATYYTIDGGGTQTYAGSAVPVSGDASHTITYWSVDNAGNIEGAHTAYMNIDTTPPSAISGLASATDPSQSSWYANATPAFSWNAATDATSGLAGYSYVLDQSAGTVPAATVNTTATSYTSAALADGTWYFHVRAIDNAGNAGTTATYCVKTDTTPPVTTDNHTSVSLVAPTTITLSATDTGSGMSGGAAATLYRIEPATSYQTGSTVTLTSPGSYTVDYYSIDAAGNQEAPQSFTVTVRAAAAPSSASAYGFAANATSDWQTTPQTVTITASGGDGASRTINYSTDGGATWSAVVADSTDVQLAADGSYHIEYYASDSLASEATHDAGWVNIDQTPPTVSSSADNDTSWYNSAVPVNVTATDTGSGVATIQYKLASAASWTDSPSGSFTVPATSDGSFTYDYRAIDEAGNISTPGSCTVNIDVTQPTISVSGADAAWHAAPVELTLNTSCGPAGLDCTEVSSDGGAAWTACSSPYEVSTEGDNSLIFRATDGAGNTATSSPVDVKIDTTPPVTTNNAPAAWQNSDTTVTLTPTDAESGMVGGAADTTYEIDGSATQSGTSVLIPAPADHSNDGVHTITYRSTDAVGNTEATKSATVRIDTTPPVTTDDVVPDAPTHSGSLTVTLTATDSASGVKATYYQVDSGPWQTGTQVTVATPGTHTVSYYSEDNAGNLEAPETSADFTIASPNPGTSSDNAPSGWQNHAVTVTITPGSDATATSYSVDGGPWQSGTSVAIPAPADHSNDGVHTISYFSTYPGGVSESTKTATVSIDTRPPATTDNAPSAWQRGPVTVTLSAGSDPSGIAATTYSLDGGPQRSGTEVIVAGNGLHTITYQSLDNAGNLEAPHSCTVRIDTTPPLVNCPQAGKWFNTKKVTVHFLATDKLSGVASVQYRLGNGPWITGSSVHIAGNGSHAISYRATDNAGNTTTVASCAVGIERRAPTLVRALASHGKADGWVALRFRISAPKPSCGWAKVTEVVITDMTGQPVATLLRFPKLVRTNANVRYRRKWNLGRGSFRFTVYVKDIAGNRSRRSSSGIVIIR